MDWLVEVQQSFELVHETLYLAVKLTDYYLDRQTTAVAKNFLQLIGSTALNIACKFEVCDVILFLLSFVFERELTRVKKHINCHLTHTYIK